jgi:hypothetical protein
VPMLMELTHLLEISQVPSCSSVIMVTVAVTAGSSSSSPEGTEHPPKNAHFEAFLQVTYRYVCRVACWLCVSCFSYFCR